MKMRSIALLLVVGLALTACDPRMPQKPKTDRAGTAVAWIDVMLSDEPMRMA